MSDDEKKESEVVQALREQYERMLEEQKQAYEAKITELKEDHTKTIKTILSSGARPVTDIPDEPQEENEEDIALANLRKKFKITK